MKLLLLRAYAAGFRGCIVDDHDYYFFQCSRKGMVKRLKSYPKKDFVDQKHFIAMMQKFVTPPAFLQPPVSIADLTLEELERAHARIVEEKSQRG